jgi:hypothetical protein
MRFYMKFALIIAFSPCSQQRTNNVESYNREFNKTMGTHSGLLDWCHSLMQEMDEWAERYDMARSGVYKEKQTHREVEWPEIPEEFENRTPPKKEVPPKKRVGKVGVSVAFEFNGFI